MEKQETIPKQSKEKIKGIGLQHLDTSKADGYAQTEFDILKESLQCQGLYTPNLLYRGTTQTRLARILETGFDLPLKRMECEGGIDFLTEKEIKDSHARIIQNPFRYARDHEQPLIVVVNGEHLIHSIGFSYLPKSGANKQDILVALYEVDR
jgi:hypothetical protein